MRTGRVVIIPRSQTPFGNALVPATPLPASSTPKGLDNRAKGWRTGAYPGNVDIAANPIRVESDPRIGSCAHDPTPTGLGRLAGLPRVGASRQPFALLLQPFQGCPKAAGIGHEMASASAFPNKIWEREDTKPRSRKNLPRSQKNLRHPERSEANDFLSPSSLTRAQSKDLAHFSGNHGSGAESLQAGPARRHEMTMPFGTAARASKTTRSFDCGSVHLGRKTNTLLASAQDDGALKSAHSSISPLPRSQVALGNARAGEVARRTRGSGAARTILPSAGPFPGATCERGEDNLP